MATHTRAFPRQRILGFGLLWLAAVVVLAITAAVASAQQPAQGQQGQGYQELPLDPSWQENSGRKQRDARRQVSQMLRDQTGAFLGDTAQRTVFIQYYTQYLQPSMTQLENLDKLPELREDFMRDIRSARNSRVRTGLLQMALNMGKTLVEGNFHPAVRANGAFLVGQLDASDFTRNSLAKPLDRGREYLFSWYANDQLPESARAASLMGLVRHALLNGPYLQPSEHRVRIAGIMLGLLNEQPPEGRDPRAHAWLQRTAIDVLIKVGAGQQPEVYQAVAALAADENAADIIRVHAAATLGTLQKPENFNGDPEKQAAAWASLLAGSFEDAAARIQKRLAPKPAAGMYGEGYGEQEGYEGYDESMMEEGYGGGYGGYGYGAPVVEEEKFEPQPKLITVLRERLNYQMEQKHRGIDGQPLGSAQEVESGLLAWSAGAEIPSTLRDAITRAQERVNDRSVYELEPFMELLNEQAEMLKQVAAMGAASGGEVEPLDADPLADPAVPAQPEQPAQAQPEVARVEGAAPAAGS